MPPCSLQHLETHQIDRWYNVWQIVQTGVVLYYANVAMPYPFDGNVLRWVDLDIVCYADGSIVVKDERESEEHISRYAYPEGVVHCALAARDELHRLAHSSALPFDRTGWSAARQSPGPKYCCQSSRI
jgi:protein associated with RNAse G/E